MRFHADTGTNRYIEKSYFHARIVGRQLLISQNILFDARSSMLVLCCPPPKIEKKVENGALSSLLEVGDLNDAKIHLRQCESACYSRVLVVRRNDELGAGDGPD